MGLLEGLRRHPQPDDPVAVLPLRVDGIHRVAEAGLGSGKAVVLAFVGEELLRPGLLDDLDGLDEERSVLLLLRVRVGVELGALVAADAASEAHFDASLRQVVEDGDVLREADGMPPHRDVGHLTDAYPRRPGRDVGADENGVGQVAAAEGLKVVLTDPHRVVSQLFGQHHLLPEVREHPVGGAANRRQRGEDGETHAVAGAVRAEASGR